MTIKAWVWAHIKFQTSFVIQDLILISKRTWKPTIFHWMSSTHLPAWLWITSCYGRSVVYSNFKSSLSFHCFLREFRLKHFCSFGEPHIVNTLPRLNTLNIEIHWTFQLSFRYPIAKVLLSTLRLSQSFSICHLPSGMPLAKVMPPWKRSFRCWYVIYDTWSWRQ